MGKGIILRVPQGLQLSAQLSETLSKLLPNYVAKPYHNKPNYVEITTQRINSLYKAFLFVVEAYPPILEPQVLKNQAQRYRRECNLSAEDVQKSLESFTAKLISILCIGWRWNGHEESYKQAIACLNEAEQYVLMQEGRYDTVTLIKLKENYILQLDESLNPCYEELKQELKQIKLSKYPKTSAWFKTLLPSEQAYFSHLRLENMTSEGVKTDLDALIQKWSQIKKASLGIEAELGLIKKQQQPLPSWFNELKPHQQEMIGILAEHPKHIDKHLLQFRKQVENNPYVALELAQKHHQLPQWYWHLSSMQQSFLEYVLKNTQQLEDAVSFLPSRHRTLPAPANFGAHSLWLIDKEGHARKLYNNRYRSSHIVSRDILSAPKSVQERHASSNFEQVTRYAKAEQPVLVQTLISPIPGDFMPDRKLYDGAKKAVRNSQHACVLQHNHPLNIAGMVYYTRADDADSAHTIKFIEDKLEADKGCQYSDLQELLADYKAVLHSSAGSATFFDHNKRELFLSSLEQLLVLTVNGYSYGSCVSAKDRKAIELIHTDSMILYKEFYGTWPKFEAVKNSEERLQFISIVVALYCSRHQQVLAGQNAPGAEGIKTPAKYWPKDISDAIHERLDLNLDDRLATNNEVKNISDSFKALLVPNNLLKPQLLTHQLDEPMCTRLYTALSHLINQHHLFDNGNNLFFTSYKSAGIKSIRRVMSDEKSGDSNIQRLAKIFSVILHHLENYPANSNKQSATQHIYSGINAVCALRPRAEQIAIAETIEENWEGIFQRSKGTTAEPAAAAASMRMDYSSSSDEEAPSLVP